MIKLIEAMLTLSFSLILLFVTIPLIVIAKQTNTLFIYGIGFLTVVILFKKYWFNEN